jgi:hypothetical protein
VREAELSDQEQVLDLDNLTLGDLLKLYDATKREIMQWEAEAKPVKHLTDSENDFRSAEAIAVAAVAKRAQTIVQARLTVTAQLLFRLATDQTIQSLVDSSVDRLVTRKLAAWITDPHNPLTARVLVNRLWQGHFGAGIVATPNDFGRMGARPTHPELLDWLANEVVANGWRQKPLHRMMVLSNTYRQASVAVPPAVTVTVWCCGLRPTAVATRS